jgi:hypothetical protein
MLPINGRQQQYQAERGYDQDLQLRLTHLSCHGCTMTAAGKEAGAGVLPQTGPNLTMPTAPPTLRPRQRQHPPPHPRTAQQQAQQADLQYQEMLQGYWHARLALRQRHLPGLELQGVGNTAAGGATSPVSPCGPLEAHAQPSSNPGSQLCAEEVLQPRPQPHPQQPTAMSHPSWTPASTAPRTLPIKRGCPGSEADPPAAQQQPASGQMPPPPPLLRRSLTPPQPAVPALPASCAAAEATAGGNRLGQQVSQLAQREVCSCLVGLAGAYCGCGIACCALLWLWDRACCAMEHGLPDAHARSAASVGVERHFTLLFHWC